MADETGKLITEFVKKLNALWTRRSEECPSCGAHVEALEQVEQNVYARPCGCSQGQGYVPEVWKKMN